MESAKQIRMQWREHLQLWGLALLPVLVVMGCGVAPALPFVAALHIAPITATWLSLPFTLAPAGVLYWQFKDQPKVPKRWTWQDGLLAGCAVAPLCWLLLAAFAPISWPVVLVLGIAATPVGGLMLGGALALIESTFPSYFPPLEEAPIASPEKPVNPVAQWDHAIRQGLLALAHKAASLEKKEAAPYWKMVKDQIQDASVATNLFKRTTCLADVYQLAQDNKQIEISSLIDRRQSVDPDWAEDTATDDPLQPNTL